MNAIRTAMMHQSVTLRTIWRCRYTQQFLSSPAPNDYAMKTLSPPAIALLSERIVMPMVSEPSPRPASGVTLPS